MRRRPTTVLPATRDRHQECKHVFVDDHLRGLLLWRQDGPHGEVGHAVWIDADMVVRQEYVAMHRITRYPGDN